MNYKKTKLKEQSHLQLHKKERGFSGGARGKEPTCQFKSHETHDFDPWVIKIPWSMIWLMLLSHFSLVQLCGTP